jgi:hypothetical protein
MVVVPPVAVPVAPDVAVLPLVVPVAVAPDVEPLVFPVVAPVGEVLLPGVVLLVCVVPPALVVAEPSVGVAPKP